MSKTQTVTEGKLKNKQQHLKSALNSSNIDEVLEKVKAVDLVCSYVNCKNRTLNFSVDCKFCGGRFCTTHGLPEIHGCGEAVRRSERKNMTKSTNKVSQEKHSATQAKLSSKLKQMQLERKKQNVKDKKK